MNKEVLYKQFFGLTSIVTDYFPKTGSQILNIVLTNILGNKILFKLLSVQAKRRIERIKILKSFLVVADLNIGDAVTCSNSLTAIRKIFPQAEIDYVIKKSTSSLLEGNPDISNLYPVFTGAPYPAESDLSELAHLAQDKQYDLIINFSPMIDDKVFGNRNVVNFSLMAEELIRQEKDKLAVNNVSFQAYRFIINLFHDLLLPDFDNHFDGSSLFLPGKDIEQAEKFLLNLAISPDTPIIMFNPDGTSKFTRIPFDIQIELLTKLAKIECVVLLGEGRFEKNIGQRLLQYLKPESRENIVIVPGSFNLAEYTALIDLSDIFITGDTGPLHLAAARKFLRSGGHTLRNKTAIFSIFGGTPARMYGYDSKKSGFFAANQDAPSRVFIGKSPCRNITCINKLAKTCSAVRCFLEIDTDEIISEAVNYLIAAQKYKSFGKTGTLPNNISS